MEPAYTLSNFYCQTGTAPVMSFQTTLTSPSVKSAKKTLKQAKAAAKADRKRQRAQARHDASAAADRALGLETLRAIAQDERKYSADARLAAANLLREVY